MYGDACLKTEMGNQTRMDGQLLPMMYIVLFTHHACMCHKNKDVLFFKNGGIYIEPS
jgi:hypothetical protein